MSSNRVTSLAAIVISVFYLYLVTDIVESPFSDPIGAKAFPLLVGGCMFFAGILLLLHDMFVERGAPLEFKFMKSGKAGTFLKSPIVVATVICIIYALTFETAGYPVATAIFFFLVMTYLQKNKLIANIVFSISFSAVSYIVFVKLLTLSFPLGILENLIRF